MEDPKKKQQGERNRQKQGQFQLMFMLFSFKAHLAKVFQGENCSQELFQPRVQISSHSLVHIHLLSDAPLMCVSVCVCGCVHRCLYCLIYQTSACDSGFFPPSFLHSSHHAEKEKKSLSANLFMLGKWKQNQRLGWLIFLPPAVSVPSTSESVRSGSLSIQKRMRKNLKIRWGFFSLSFQ